MPRALPRLFWLAFAWPGLAGAALAAPPDYRIGPQDHLQIKVFDWRTGTGDVHEWSALNDEVTVGATGKVSLPLIGEVDGNGLTTAALADAIATRLQNKIGLSARPDASVEVVRYRPFYILGSVEKPGEYDYRPGLTILQAVGTAGGMSRAQDAGALGLEREAIATRGDLRALLSERTGLLIRQARLDAEVKGLDAVAFPGFATEPGDDPDVSRARREEQLLFEAHRDSLASQVANLAASRELLGTEVKSLAAKDASLAHQLEVTQKQLEGITALVSKGLTVLPRQLEAEQSTASFQSSRLDVQLASLRARQDIAKAQRDEIDLKAARRTDALKQATEVHARLVGLDEKIETARRLLYQTEVRAPAVLDLSPGVRRQPTYRITRPAGDGPPQIIAAGENDTVQPGDTVLVEMRSADAVATTAQRTN